MVSVHSSMGVSREACFMALMVGILTTAYETRHRTLSHTIAAVD